MTRFVDKRGWEYEVRPGLQGKYKVFYRKPKPGQKNDFGWHARRASDWFADEAAAVSDLLKTAVKNKWRRIS